MLYTIRTGYSWHDMSASCGQSKSIFKRFNRWSNSSKLLTILKLLSMNTHMEWLFIDGSYILDYQYSAGITDQAISKSAGGNSSKIHFVVDSNGNTIDFIITDGTTHDVKVAPDLISRLGLNKV